MKKNRDMTDRKAKLAAAAIIYKMFNDSLHASRKHSCEIEDMLRKDLDKAQAALDSFLKSKAAALALDSLLPGWVEIDASDHLPKEKWHTFMSNDKSEWLEWLLANGVPQDDAKRLVKEGFSP